MTRTRPALTRPRRHGTCSVGRAQGQNTALHYAARGGFAAICEALLDAGANVNMANAPRGVRTQMRQRRHCRGALTPWRRAVMTRRCVARAQGCKAPLLTAAMEGHLDACKVLLERGANVNGEDSVRVAATALLRCA